MVQTLFVLLKCNGTVTGTVSAAWLGWDAALDILDDITDYGQPIDRAAKTYNFKTNVSYIDNRVRLCFIILTELLIKFLSIDFNRH